MRGPSGKSTKAWMYGALNPIGATWTTVKVSILPLELKAVSCMVSSLIHIGQTGRLGKNIRPQALHLLPIKYDLSPGDVASCIIPGRMGRRFFSISWFIKTLPNDPKADSLFFK
jgi:hypothetical protein